ncbi:MAG: response regulator [Anaerolineae bacterium]
MKQKRVLIVDDEPNVAMVLSACLERLGDDYICEIAHNGSEALSKLQQASYTLLLTDYNMPGMTGLELAQAVRSHSPATQVVLMTAYGTESFHDALGSLKLDGYIGKPFTADEIREIVKQVVSRANAATQTETVHNNADDPIVDQAIEQQLKSLRSHTGARCVLLLSSNGYAVNVVGQTQDLDITSVGALVAANFMAAAELAKLLGGRSVFKSSYHEGDDYNIYAYKVNDDLLLAVLFGSESKPGVVWFYTKQTAVALLPLVPAQPARITFAENINTVLEAEFDQLFSSELPNDNKSNLVEPGYSKPMTFEEAVAAGLVPAQIANREKPKIRI